MLSTSSGLYVLFFDGGSRGNPGPGGSGSVLVRVEPTTHSAQIIWVASMAYANKRTTNNWAEYMGLVHGLRRAAISNATPLHVVGDSAMIISQLRQRKPPKKPHLAWLYKEARSLADDLEVSSWTHHYRAHNKMADLAANIAMNSGTSSQTAAPSGRPIFTELDAHLDNDMSHWIEAPAPTGGLDTFTSSARSKDHAITAHQRQRRVQALGGRMHV